MVKSVDLYLIEKVSLLRWGGGFFVTENHYNVNALRQNIELYKSTSMVLFVFETDSGHRREPE